MLWVQKFNDQFMQSSKKLRTLLVTFENNIPPHQLTAFRGAVIEKVGRENVAFHNHIGQAAFVYHYPLIQYKNAFSQPAIFCLEEGVEEIHKLFGKSDWVIDFLNEKIELKVDRLDLKSTTLSVWDSDINYHLYRWQALNENNYRAYNLLKSLSEKIQMLERILTGNILSFAKGIDWHIEKPVKVCISSMPHYRLNKMKDIQVAALDIDFSCNISLPDWIGLGKGVSKGFGVVRRRKN